MVKLILIFLASYIFSVCIMPIIIKIFRKKQASQTILGYVEEHKSKNGTLTMGGVVFMITTLVMSFAFIKFDLDWFVCLVVALFFGVLGFMDDHLKIKYKQNLGLRAYQKIIGQVGIATIFAFFIYFGSQSGNIFLLFSEKSCNIKWLIIPFVILVLVATTNSVNLTDGLDGLAGSVSFVYLLMFIAITCIVQNKLYLNGETGKIITNMQNVNLMSASFMGAILGFLMFNTNKASIFMGDVGSLCLGGYIGASACLIGFELLILLLGVCFVFSAFSVILQVIVFKLTKKRVFKMAPFHHHLQMSGLSEPKIVAIYSAVTFCVGLICIIFYLL